MLKTALTEMFGLRYPIIQAPMAGAAGGRLAGAVARAGGLGMLPTGSRATAAALQGEWNLLEGAQPVGIGFMTWALDRYPEQRDLLRTALALKPAAVLLSFADPGPYAPEIKAAGARLICQVQSAADADLALKAGADLLVAQGTEAGGHTGHEPMDSVLEAVLALAGPVPVVAAGGIGTGADLAAVLKQGACGAMIGTRFAATPEGVFHPIAKERIIQATEADTVLTRVFDIVQGIPWPERFPGRALLNRFTAAWHGREEALQAELPGQQAAYDSARQRTDYETMVVYAGQVAGRIDALVPAADLVRQIGEEAAALTRQ